MSALSRRPKRSSGFRVIKPFHTIYIYIYIYIYTTCLLFFVFFSFCLRPSYPETRIFSHLLRVFFYDRRLSVQSKVRRQGSCPSQGVIAKALSQVKTPSATTPFLESRLHSRDVSAATCQLNSNNLWILRGWR